MTRVAAIDCGTNSIRLLVADVTTDDGTPRLHDLTRQMRIVRLGQGVDRTGMLSAEAIARTLDAVGEYRRMLDNLGAEKIRFVATSAMRDARNRAELIDGVTDILGIAPEVIPGTEEASLSFSGATSGVGAQEERPLLVVDIGGGSTELVIGTHAIDEAYSIDMGSVRVTEKFFAHCASDQGIPRGVEQQAAEWIDAQLDAAEEHVDLTRVRTLVGVAGTVTTVTAHALGLTSYQPEKIDGAVLTREEIQRSVRFMVDQPLAIKAALGFMPEGRADVIAAGALIWERVIERVVRRAAEKGHLIDHVVTSVHDILDGIALSML